MSSERQKKIDEKLWQIEREKKQNSFLEKVASLNLELTLLSFEESDWFQNSSDEWPDRYKDELVFQFEVEAFIEVEKLITKYLNNIETSFVYIFLMNFNFGLIEISKQDFLRSWRNIIEIDGDEVFCFNPIKRNFILVEKTEELIEGQKKWIYEITLSNKELKNIVEKNGL